MDQLNPDSVQAAARGGGHQTAHLFCQRAGRVRACYGKAMRRRTRQMVSPLRKLRSVCLSLRVVYPKLFEAVTGTEEYHKNSLQTMLAMLDRMGDGDLSQHQASVIVGQRLVQTFVKPQLQRQ
jgi:hypothetical protein